MFRTRDFVLLFVTIVFLLVAIGSTIFHKNNETENASNLPFADSGEVERTAVLATTESLSREEKLKSMRQKIAESEKLSISNADEPEIVNQEEDVEEVLSDSTIQLCDTYQVFSYPWPSSGVQSEVSEGARIFYTEADTLVEGASLSSSTPIGPAKDILLQLPIKSVPTSNTFCIDSDVIGIAKDGSLIRNNETGLYSVFSDTTVVGYTLDGYPLFGGTSNELDECGGAITEAGYGYFIQVGSEMIISCYRALPVSI